jgi:hypothetical protein
MAESQNMVATSGGTALDITTSSIPEAPIASAEVTLDDPLFFGESYSIELSYDIPDTRREGLLVTSAYAFVPVVALGDNATVEVNLPRSQPWAASLEPADCAGDGGSFTCSGSDGMYVAALAEVTRPDLTASTTTHVQLAEKALNLEITYFQGEEAFANHVKELAAAALPIMEELYGFKYRGPEEVRLEERGSVITLGYEGLASCGETFCTIAVSPVASDRTLLHELAHLWSDIYDRRWLAEGFAELIAVETSGRLAGLVTGTPDDFEPPQVELQLDDWGGVPVGAGLNGEQRDYENTGYYRSERFLSLLQSELGLQALQTANAALADSGSAIDSRQFMDALEAASSRNSDALFREWVFPSSYDERLAQRREARDRLTTLIARAQEEGLSDRVPGEIEADIDEWDFDSALASLDEKEEWLADYLALKSDLVALRTDAEAAGLAPGPGLQEALDRWDFDHAAGIVAEARQALALYLAARERVDEPRSLWERFGLLGSDPNGDLTAAAEAFNAADYGSAERHADDAIDTVNSASTDAARRVFIVAGGAALFAIAILLIVWFGRRRQHEPWPY